jgi:PEP-CTERM motif
MAQHTHALRASALMLALIAQGAHAGLTVTSMSQTASATAAARYYFQSHSQSQNCCADTVAVGPSPLTKVATSPTGQIGTLDQSTSARQEFAGVIAESQSQGHMTLLDDGLLMTSNGSVRHVFPTGLDKGFSTNYTLESKSAGGEDSAMASVIQTAGFRLDQDTQVLVDWSYKAQSPNAYGFGILGAAQGFTITNTQGFGVMRTNLAGTSSSLLLDLTAGDYVFQFTTPVGATIGTPGVRTTDWQNIASIRAVPEASTWAMMGLGLTAMGWVARRRSTAAQA